MTTPERPPTDRADLLAAAHAAGLWTPGQAAKAAAAVPSPARTATAAADHLIDAGLLTRFQADRLLAGRTDGFVFDGYVIQGQAGKGAAARVYKAVHRAMGRTVAVKLLRAELTRTDEARDLFDREARAAAKLNHPHVATTYDANRVGDRCYLVTEYVDGPTAAALVADRGPLPVAEACELVRQAAVGLGHAHEQGMAHRSLSPSSLLVSRPSKNLPGCVVKLSGFGTARLAAPAGDPDYAPPEQAENPQSADYRADLYALGGIFYFLLTGRPPFPGGTAADKVRRHRGVAPEPVGRVRPDVPAAVAEVVHRLLAKDPNSRFQSAAGVAARVDGLAAGAVEVEDDGAFIAFDLPAVVPGMYSASGGGLTEVYRPGAGAVAADTCPWAEITAETPRPTVADPTPVPDLEGVAADPEPAPRRGLPAGLLAAAGGALLAAGVGLGYLAMRLAG